MQQALKSYQSAINRQIWSHWRPNPSKKFTTCPERNVVRTNAIKSEKLAKNKNVDRNRSLALLTNEPDATTSPSSLTRFYFNKLYSNVPERASFSLCLLPRNIVSKKLR